MYFFATLTTRRRFASARCFWALAPSRLTPREVHPEHELVGVEALSDVCVLEELRQPDDGDVLADDVCGLLGEHMAVQRQLDYLLTDLNDLLAPPSSE